MKLGKKIILSGMVLLQTFNALSNQVPEIKAEDFSENKIKAEIVVENKESKDNIMFEKINGDKITAIEILKNEESGVFKNPEKENQIMIISFKNLDKLEEELKDTGLYKPAVFDRMVKEENEEAGSYQTTVLPRDKVDYNHISLSKNQIKNIKKIAEKKEYSKELIELVGLSVLFHEMGHSHDHKGDETGYMVEALDSMSTFDKILNSREINKDIREYKYIGENYADSFMLLRMSEYIQSNNKIENKKELFIEVYDLYMNEMRDDTVYKKEYDTHASKAVLHSTANFILNNWDLTGKLNIDEQQQISASITNGTINQPEIIATQMTKLDQNKLAKKGGMEKSVLDSVSYRVNLVMDDMVKMKIDENGEEIKVFEYKANAHNDSINQASKEFKNNLKNSY